MAGKPSKQSLQLSEEQFDLLEKWLDARVKLKTAYLQNPKVSKGRIYYLGKDCDEARNLLRQSLNVGNGA